MSCNRCTFLYICLVVYEYEYIVLVPGIRFWIKRVSRDGTDSFKTIKPNLARLAGRLGVGDCKIARFRYGTDTVQVYRCSMQSLCCSVFPAVR